MGVAKVARRSAFGKGGSLPADAFPRRFTDLSQAERRRNPCDQGARHSGAEPTAPPEVAGPMTGSAMSRESIATILAEGRCQYRLACG